MTRKTSVLDWSFVFATILLSSQLLATPLAGARPIGAAASGHPPLMFNRASGPARGHMPLGSVRGDCFHFGVSPKLMDGRVGSRCKYKVESANSDVETLLLASRRVADRKRQQFILDISASSPADGARPTRAYPSDITAVSMVSPRLTQPRVCESPMRGRFFHDDVHAGLGCDDRIFDEPTALDGFARMRYHIPVPK